MPFTEPALPPDFRALSDAYLQPESDCAENLAQAALVPAQTLSEIDATAAALTECLLDDARHMSAVDAFLNAYTLSSEEGVLLMRLAESLVRTPDAHTARLLLRDKIAAGTWWPHLSASHLLVKLGTLGLSAAKGWIQISGGPGASNALAQLGDRAILFAVRRAIALLGHHFVLGASIKAATRRARTLSDYGATYSYDMLGEAAMTQADADRYFEAYQRALDHLATTSSPHEDLHRSPALSVKLSALHPRYEYAQRDRCVPALTARVLTLCEQAKAANIGLTIDAEEVDRLEVSLHVIDAVLRTESIRGWDGFGLAIQAYQKRALPTIDWIHAAAKQYKQRLTVRLVKGAYWDSEIKRAQELGLSDYPVFTRKEHTDLSYLACAKKLLDAGQWIYPQFATHNARTAASVLHMAGTRRDYEFQRLHGMSDGLHRRLAQTYGIATRTYAPVGRHKELLPYLVRRLLENGANSSFVNQLLDAEGDVTGLIQDPIALARAQGFSPHPFLPLPRIRSGQKRVVAAGQDLTESRTALAIERLPAQIIAAPPPNPISIDQAVAASRESGWSDTLVRDRSTILRRAANLFEDHRETLMAHCVYEAHKTWPDAEAELREAIDFLNYYADQAERPDIATRQALGPVVCISPWNFPLAIFVGQVSAALSVGNTALAKPAEQTPRIAALAVQLFHQAGIPNDALHLLIGDGRVGAELVAHHGINAVCFTGSTETAKKIAVALAETDRGDVPLIAETGGINAMLIDSTALLEQAVRDVIASAFQSAGQRCSACRLVCVQDDVADAFDTMLAGAIKTLRVGAPSDLSTDLGPIIDAQAHERIASHVTAFKQCFRVIGEATDPQGSATPFVAPIAFALDSIADLTEEIFGPVLHVVRFKSNAIDDVVAQINALGFGLTMGLHTRLDTRARAVQAQAQVGNLYVNRNQIGAMVGEQPFGGEGLSGTGPKAGGPNYLKRLTHATNREAPPDLNTDIDLPGPTGEQNTLRYAPRGLILCLGGDDPETLQQQIERVRSTGNTTLLFDHDSLEAALAHPDLRGVLADGEMRAGLAQKLAHRPGPILPLLSVNDDPARFLLERVTCIDTTAAGGNASLLAKI